jgi:hypothetical protein
MHNVKPKIAQVVRHCSLLVLPCIVLLSGCAFRAQPSEPMTEMPLQPATVERLMALLQEREAEIQTLKGLFRAQIQGPGLPGTQQVEGAVVYHRPDALRLRGFNRIGMRLFELGIGEDRYTLRLVNGKVLTGNMADLDRIEKIARPFRLSVLAMSGIIGTAPVGSRDRAVLKQDGDRYRLDVFGPDPGLTPGFNGGEFPYRQIWFDGRSLQVVQEDRLTPAGDIEATVLFEDFRPVNLSPDGGIFPVDTSAVRSVLKPFVIRGQESQGHSTIQLTFREIVPNMPVKAEELQVTGSATVGDGTIG